MSKDLQEMIKPDNNPNSLNTTLQNEKFGKDEERKINYSTK